MREEKNEQEGNRDNGGKGGTMRTREEQRGQLQPAEPIISGPSSALQESSAARPDLQSMWQSDRMKAAPSLGTQLRNHQKRCSGHLLF